MDKIQGKLLVQINKLPSVPGVYFFIGKNNKILYIGKATSLRSRVRSYLTKDIAEKRSLLIQRMVGDATSIKFEKTDSVLEALILESKLIKKHSPPYNTADKDQKSFNYVVITAEEFPRVLIVREREIASPQPLPLGEGPRGGAIIHFGPFPHGAELKEALKIIRKIFPFRDKCGVGEGRRGCFNYQIGLCPGICAGVITEKEYAKTIKHIKTFFEGNKKKLVRDLEKEMKELAKKREFEKAAGVKKKIFALKHIQDIALIKREAKSLELGAFRIEAYDVAHISGTNMVGVMTVVEAGEINKKEYRMFKIRGQRGADPTSLKLRGASDTATLKEILERRLKHREWQMPSLIVVDGGVAQLNTAENLLTEKNIKIPVVAVIKDEKHKARKIQGATHEVRDTIKKYEKQILLANSEAHRFAITFHRKLRDTLF